MDLWQLHIFCRVVESRSFSRAARAVHLSQPTISSHIKHLEEHFGTRLIDRLGKEAAPTRAGELLYDYAVRLLAIRDEAESAVKASENLIRGRLKVGGSTITGVYILPRLLGDFIRQYPEVTLSVSVSGTEKVIAEVLSGDLEMGIVGAKSPNRGIYQERLVEDDLRLAVPAGHRWAKQRDAALPDLLKEPFILREPGSGTLSAIVASLEAAGHTIDEMNVVAEMGSTGAVIEGIKSGLGVSILSAVSVTDELAAGLLSVLSVKGLSLKRSFYLTRSRHRTPSPICRVFAGYVKNNAAGVVNRSATARPAKETTSKETKN